MSISNSSIGGLLAGLALSAFSTVDLYGDQIIFNWEKPGDKEGWVQPDEKYRKEYGMLSGEQQSADQAFVGKGSLKMMLDTSTGARKGRLDKFYGGKADWKNFKTFSVMCRIPEGAPAIQGQIAVMSGAWKWSQSKIIPCVAGDWTKITLETSEIASPEEIQLLMFMAYCPSGDFKGEIYLDKAALEGEITVEPSKPGAAPTSESSTWIETFDNTEGWERQGGARIEPASQAAVGSGAATFSMPGTMTRKIKSPKPLANEALDEGYPGISFWAKGDGSDQFGTLVLCGMHPQWFPFKYGYSVPLKDTNWKRYVVSWRDMIPEDATYPVGTPGGAPPSNLQFLKIGSKWTITHNNKPLPKFSFSIDHIQLESVVPDASPIPSLQTIDTVRAKLTAKQPVSILCLGDSITAGTSLGNPDNERYAQVLERMLRERLGTDTVTVVSRAVGGAQGNDLRLWTERDFTGIEPDLTIIMFGYNDKTWGYPADYYGYVLSDYVDRIAAKTSGKTSVLLLPPIPGRGPRFVMMDDYAETARKIAAERGLALCDVNKVFKTFGREGLNTYMADDAHPNAKGHVLMAQTIADVLVPTK